MTPDAPPHKVPVIHAEPDATAPCGAIYLYADGFVIGWADPALHPVETAQVHNLAAGVSVAYRTMKRQTDGAARSPKDLGPGEPAPEARPL